MEVTGKKICACIYVKLQVCMTEDSVCKIRKIRDCQKIFERNVLDKRFYKLKMEKQPGRKLNERVSREKYKRPINICKDV